MKTKTASPCAPVIGGANLWSEYQKLFGEVPAAERRCREAEVGGKYGSDQAEDARAAMMDRLDDIGDKIVFVLASGSDHLAKQAAIAAVRAKMTDDEAMPGLLAFAQISANAIALAVREGHMDAAKFITGVVAKRLDMVDGTVAHLVVAHLSEALLRREAA